MDINELATFEGIGAGSDLLTEELQLEGILTANALKHAKRVPDGLARVLGPDLEPTFPKAPAGRPATLRLTVPASHSCTDADLARLSSEYGPDLNVLASDQVTPNGPISEGEGAQIWAQCFR